MRKNNGITLISLVITIIVMLILVGVSITLAVNGGLFEYAGNAVGDTKNAMKNEQGLIDDIIENYINTNVPIEGNDGEMFSPIYTENTEIIQGDYKATIPAGFAVGTSEGINKIENGLVIRDKDGNEFVWVPCTTDKENTSVIQYAQDKKYNVGENAKEFGYSKYSWKDNGGNETSVTKYGGFYVARYEAGIPNDEESIYPNEGNNYKYFYKDDNENIVRDTAEFVPVSRKNNPSWNYISQKNAVIVSEKMYEGSASVTSNLIDSYAWDTIVNWMESKKTGIATNSLEYGNYVESTMSLKNAVWAQFTIDYDVWELKEKPQNYQTEILNMESRIDSGIQKLYELATGTTEDTKVLNIYDMAGNMWEWTTEIVDDNNKNYCVARGGSFNSFESKYPISSRYGDNEKEVRAFDFGFRVVLYVK